MWWSRPSAALRARACGRTRWRTPRSCPSSRPRRFRSLSRPAIGLSTARQFFAWLAFRPPWASQTPGPAGAVLDLDEPHAALDQPPRRQHLHAERRASPAGRGRRASSSPPSPSRSRAPRAATSASGTPARSDLMRAVEGRVVGVLDRRGACSACRPGRSRARCSSRLTGRFRLAVVERVGRDRRGAAPRRAPGRGSGRPSSSSTRGCPSR